MTTTMFEYDQDVLLFSKGADNKLDMHVVGKGTYRDVEKLMKNWKKDLCVIIKKARKELDGELGTDHA